ncbi:hypothetical protein GCM10027075_23700 [Streptomyces heilongjiangensis]
MAVRGAAPGSGTASTPTLPWPGAAPQAAKVPAGGRGSRPGGAGRTPDDPARRITHRFGHSAEFAGAADVPG